MVTKAIKENVKSSLIRYKKLKETFMIFCDLCYEMLSEDNFFEMSTQKVKNGRFKISMLCTTLYLQFSIKKNKGGFLPIGCIDFFTTCEGDSLKLWSLYFDEDGNVFETITTNFNSANLSNTEGIESFLYLILDKYMKHPCFEIETEEENKKT